MQEGAFRNLVYEKTKPCYCTWDLGAPLNTINLVFQLDGPFIERFLRTYVPIATEAEAVYEYVTLFKPCCVNKAVTATCRFKCAAHKCRCV